MYWVVSYLEGYRFEGRLASTSRCLGSTLFIDYDELCKFDDQLLLAVL